MRGPVRDLAWRNYAEKGVPIVLNGTPTTTFC
jgi:hypothetical protein